MLQNIVKLIDFLQRLCIIYNSKPRLGLEYL